MPQLDACTLVAQVAARRVEDMVSDNGSGVRSLLALVGFPSEQTEAIGSLLKTRHPNYEIVVNEAGSNAVDYRNRRTPGCEATIISIPLDGLTSVEQSLGHVTVVGEPALLVPSEAETWSSIALHSHTANPNEEILLQLRNVIDGLLRSEVANSATMVGTFVSEVVNLHAGRSGLPIAEAVRQSMHLLQLVAPPIDGKSKSIVSNRNESKRYFIRASWRSASSRRAGSASCGWSSSSRNTSGPPPSTPRLSNRNARSRAPTTACGPNSSTSTR